MRVQGIVLGWGNEMKEKKPSKNKEPTTTIRITYRLKAELDKLVELKSDTYETILWRLLEGRVKK